VSATCVDAVPVALLAILCAAAGYVVGSLPVAAWVTRAAGPGWGLLALTADLSKGVLPVALATVTWSRAAGLVAGLGAIAGALWPALGRIPGGGGAGGVAVFVGVVFVLAPPAGIAIALIALAVAGGARLAGRR
jgi:glycerol-3-phosphate acyltransferase PlsY